MTAQLNKNEAKNRYEIIVDGAVAGFIDYERDDRVIDLLHTEVDDSYRGQGLAQQLADYALDDIREAGLLVRPTCPFIAKHIEQNPDYGTILAAD